MKFYFPNYYILGLSDPYVTIELLPKFVFPKCPELVTAVQKATLQPSFEETFEL